MGYLIAALTAAVVVLGGLVKMYRGKIKDQSAEIDQRDKRIAQLYKQNAEVTALLEKLKSIEKKRRKKNAEIDNTDDADLADSLNDILSNDG